MKGRRNTRGGESRAEGNRRRGCMVRVLKKGTNERKRQALKDEQKVLERNKKKKIKGKEE